MGERRTTEAVLMDVKRSIQSVVTASRALLLTAQRTKDKASIATARRNLRKVEAMRRAISDNELWSDLRALDTNLQVAYRALS